MPKGKPMARGKRKGWDSTLANGKPPKAKGKPRFKVSGQRDEAFRDFIRHQPCIVAGRPGHTCRGAVECAHLKSRGAGGTDRGGNCVSLCARAHGEQHAMGIQTFARVTGLDLKAEAVRLECAFVLRDFGGADPTREDR